MKEAQKAGRKNSRVRELLAAVWSPIRGDFQLSADFFNRLVHLYSITYCSLVAGPSSDPSPKASRIRCHKPCLSHTRSVGRLAPICRTPPASPARTIRSSPPTTSLPAPRGGRGRSACLASLGRQQRTHRRPLLVGAARLLRRDRDRLLRSFPAGRGSRGAFRRQASLAAAGRYRLVRPPPIDHPRRKPLRLFGAFIASTSRLASGTVGGIRPRSRSPFLAASCCSAEERTTARKAWRTGTGLRPGPSAPLPAS